MPRCSEILWPDLTGQSLSALFFGGCFDCRECNTRRKAPDVGILYGATCCIARDAIDSGGIEGGGLKDIRGGEGSYSFRGVKSHRAWDNGI